MALPRFAKETVVVITPTTRVVNGLPRYDYGAGATRKPWFKRCWATPGPSDEEKELANSVEIQYTILFPPHAEGTIDEDSHVEYKGIEYAVWGRPKPIPSPTGLTAHLHVSLKTRKG